MQTNFNETRYTRIGKTDILVDKQGTQKDYLECLSKFPMIQIVDVNVFKIAARVNHV